MKVRWLCVGNEAENDIPQWMRCAALADDGTIFAPAAIVGDEGLVFLAASWDDMPCVIDGDHYYFPTHWMAREWPDIADICLRIERRVRGHFKTFRATETIGETE